VSLSGENYHCYVYQDGSRTKVRVEIDKEMSLDDFQYWRERIIEFLVHLELEEYTEK